MGEDISAGVVDYLFGQSVALSSDGSIVAVGAQNREGNGADCGRARVYSRASTENQWSQDGAEINAETVDSLSLSADGGTLAVSGARVYRLQLGSPQWIRVGDDVLAESVSLSADGSSLAIARYQNPDGPAYARLFNIGASCLDRATARPTSAPLPEPTTVPTPTMSTNKNQTTEPVNSPAEPASGGVQLEMSFGGPTIEFSGEEELTRQERFLFERLSEDWYKGFFDKRQIAGNTTIECYPIGARDMTTRFTVLSQEEVPADVDEGRLVAVNTITYDQIIEYPAFDDALTAEDYVVLPFQCSEENQAYGDMLAATIDALCHVQMPIELPTLPSSAEDSHHDGGEELSIGAGAGSAVAAAVVLMLVTALGIWKCRSSRIRNESDDTPAFIGPVNATPVFDRFLVIAEAEVLENQPNPGVQRQDRHYNASDPVVHVEPAPVRTAMETVPDYKDQVRSVKPRRSEYRVLSKLPGMCFQSQRISSDLPNLSVIIINKDKLHRRYPPATCDTLQA